ncbi:MAG: aminoacyl-tRNA hydrolase [Saprospiraceae bacterium]|nr:aminoacyl-tRNA hydrolase [Saprospiraceae bacterium]MBP6568423.1 aminoacyl-tRNA hydrolase [Saprospiraceae bacterium]
MDAKLTDLTSECIFSTSRSSGPGGQNVNKTETKVELRFNIYDSQLLLPDQKNVLVAKLAGKLVDNDTTILITSQESRSQLQNKLNAINKLHELIARMLMPEIPRKPTKPTKASKEKRIAEKKQIGDIKSMRGNLKNKELEE